MDDIPLADAKLNLEDLVARAVRGEDIRIVHGSGSVRLSPIEGDNVAPRGRRLGLLEGKFQSPAEMFEPLPESELARWWGRGA